MKYDCILWDFNGTILDDVAPCLCCLNTLLSRRNLKQVALDEYKKLFTFPIIDYYAKVFDLNKYPYKILAEEWTELYRANKDICLYRGARETLKALSERGLTQVILSASEKNTLEKQLNEYGIRSYFDDILALDNIHAETKKGIALSWREQNKNVKALMIGDTLHDKEVADAIEADCILIPNGHQDISILQGSAPLCKDVSLIPQFID